MNIYSQLFEENSGKKKFAVLVDPDRSKIGNLDKIVDKAHSCGVDFFLIGGSLLSSDAMDEAIDAIKRVSDVPVVIFPGNSMQINPKADAILFLSLISGRNPEMLIGKHVEAAPYIKTVGLEAVGTGYMIIDNGKPSTVSYMSNSFPIPYEKKDIAVCTAMAGEMLGLKLIFMDAGSGASKPISPEMIAGVKENISVPLIVGGGIKDAETAKKVFEAGADVVVVGNAIEENVSLIADFAAVRDSVNASLLVK